MIAVTPLLHEIIPHGWARWALLDLEVKCGRGYSENAATAALYRERLGRFWDDPSSPLFMWAPSARAAGIGWTLHWQGRGWLESAHYRELEAPLDACWILDAMVGDGGCAIAVVHLTRPRSARPFRVDDAQRFGHVRSWLAHGLRQRAADFDHTIDQESCRTAGTSIHSGQLILTPDANIFLQTPGAEFLLRILEGGSTYCTRYTPGKDRLPTPISKLLRQIVGAANGTSNTPPRMLLSTAYGVLTLEAKWLIPGNTIPADVARDPKSCLIAVTIELREHALARAARVLRESGATPAQMKVGIQLARGKGKPAIADALGIELSSVASLAKKLYQTLEIHDSTELATKIWLGETCNDRRRFLPPGPQASIAHGARKPLSLSLFRSP